MTAKLPASGPPVAPDPMGQAGQMAATLAMLEVAIGDTCVPASTRALLERARDTLRASSRDAEVASQRYRALFDAAPDPVCILDADGNLLDLNKTGLAAYRRPRDAIIGQPLLALHPDLPRDYLNSVWEALSRGETCVVEVSHMRADGTRYPVELHSAGFDHDDCKCIVAVARDLSDRRAAEQCYRELMQAIDQGVLVRDGAGRLVHANAAAMRLFGISPEQSLEQALDPSHWLIVDEHGQQLAEQQHPALRAPGSGQPEASTVLGFYHRQRHELSWLSMAARPHYAAGDDRPQQVLSLFTDVTSLKRDSTLLDRVQKLAHIGGWEWDSCRDRLYLTAETQRILGQPSPPETMAVLLACLGEGDRRRLRLELDKAVAIGRHFDLELQGVRGDGHTFWVRVIGAAGVGDLLSSRLTGTLQDITHRKHADESLRVQARSDPLTGLVNRDAVLVELEARLDDPTQSALAVLYIDLDRFKVVNDVLGHAAGDRLLASAASRIQRAVGSESLIARFGGDEFLVVCTTGDDPTRPQRLAKAILEAFADSFRIDGEEFSITASIGLAHAPTDGGRPQALIQAADVAMNESKRRGRSGWQAFTPVLAAEQLHRLQLESQLRHAVGNDEFYLVYQPQVDLVTGATVAAEALIRWRNQSLGEMRPDRFIGHAEATGDIVGIGGWVLREACRQMRHWRDRGMQLDRVAVNVSYRQFLGESLSRNVRAALDEFGLPGSALELEFTERVMIEDVPVTLRTFAELRDMGVMLTIDDFGEGYSALNYLRRLPIHGLKLSQLFVQGVPDNQSDVTVCQAVTDIARNLGLSLVAEGVETDRQRKFLLELGVAVGQGFLFAPGLLPDELQRRYSRTAPELR